MSPTVITESVSFTVTINAAKGRNLAVIDLLGVFPNAGMDEVVHMVIHGKLAELKEKCVPQIHWKYLIFQTNAKFSSMWCQKRHCMDV